MSTTKILAISLGVITLLAWGGFSVGKKIRGGSSVASDSKSGFALVNAQPGYKEFDVIMDNNRYNPSVITVNQGDRVVINLKNNDVVGHGVGIAKFNATVPGGHLPPGGAARLDFIATSKGSIDAATCGGPNPTDKTDDHGEEFIVNVV